MNRSFSHQAAEKYCEKMGHTPQSCYGQNYFYIVKRAFQSGFIEGWRFCRFLNNQNHSSNKGEGMKHTYAVHGLTAAQLKKVQKVLGSVDVEEEEEEVVKPSKKSSKKASKKKVVEEEEEEEEEVEEDEDEDGEPDFDEEDEDTEEDEDEESEDEDDSDDEEEDEPKKSSKKSVKKSSSKTSSPASSTKKGTTLEDVISASKAANVRLKKKFKDDAKAQSKINSLLKKHGAKSTRTLEKSKYKAFMKDLAAL